MNKFLLAALLVCTLHPPVRADDFVESYADAHARASLLDGTAESKAFAPLVSKALASPVVEIIRECAAHIKPDGPINLVLILDPDGGVRRVIPEPWQPMAACVAGKLGTMRFPPPPRPDWPVFVTVNIR